MFICQICLKEFPSINSLVSHLSQPNKSCTSNIKEYYDKYLKQPNEGYCQTCGCVTKFMGMSNGYPAIYCPIHKNDNPKSKSIRTINSQIKNH